MTKNTVTTEILAPAGEWSSLIAATDAGAGAVYFGVEGLNMRSSARNFTADELPDIMQHCRDSGIRGYLTLNTVVYEHELTMLNKILDAAASAGVNAVIASDFAVIQGAHTRGIELHISTQMSLSNSHALSFFYHKFGVRRFVMARECTLDDIALIRRNLAQIHNINADTVELEAFAHGAMCVAVSGRCFMSQFQYGKSANRGECLQPCRREYRVTNIEEDQEFDLGNHYVMSPRDLCTLPFVEKLLEAGISSLKIEGRNRSPEYAATVVRAYREVVDAWHNRQSSPDSAREFAALKEQHMNLMKQVFNRGFSQGFFMGQPIDAWTKSGGSLATHRKLYVGFVTNYYARPGVAEVLVQDNPLTTGDQIIFTGNKTGIVEQTAESMQVEHSPIETVERGSMAAIKVKSPVRRNDKLYKLAELPTERPPD